MYYKKADICSIETGEVFHIFTEEEAHRNNGRWVRQIVKANYTVIREEISYNTLTFWVAEREG